MLAALSLALPLAFGSPPPATLRAELVGPGIVSTPDDEFGFALTPDGGAAYFTKRTPTTNTRPRTVICVTRLVHGRWAEPEVAPFSGRYNDQSPAVSPDGNRIVFASDRPRPGEDGRARDYDLWVVTRSGAGWDEPRDLGAPINSPANESGPSFAGDGTLYFASSRDGGRGGSDLYRARPIPGGYEAPTNLAGINTEADEAQPAISRDGRTLVFMSAGRPGALVGGGAPYGRTDLYSSHPEGEGWSFPRHLDPPINSTANESNPAFSPDGRWLYFASERGFVQIPMPRRLGPAEIASRLRSIENGWNNVYRVPAEVVTRGAGGSEPRMLGEGSISTAADEFGGQLTADRRTIYFNRSVPRSQWYAIFESHWRDARWSLPALVPFSGTWRDFDATLSPDGTRLFFISDRPVASGQPQHNYNIWVVDGVHRGGTTARPLGQPINGEWGNHFASPAANATLYFTSDRPGGLGPIDVWRAPWLGDRYGPPENLGATINGPGWFNLEAFVAPDESYLVVSAFGHDDSFGDSDLYLSVRVDGHWGPLRHLGAGINSAARDYSPRVTPDGRTLVFASERGVPTAERAAPWSYSELVAAIRRPGNGLGDLYEVSMETAMAAGSESSRSIR